MIKPTTGQRTIGLLGLLTAHLALVAPAAAQNLHVAGKIGVGTTSPSLPLHVATCGQQAGCVAGDVSLSGGGYALFGNQSGLNLALDDNEIMSRSAGQPSSLYVNKDGGDIRLNLISGTTIVGDASTSRNRPLWVQGGNNIHLTDFNTGFIQAGANNGPNLVIDTNEIMARNNSGPLATGAPLYLNYYPGGQVRMMMPILISSDVRLKTSIAPISSALERLRRLRGVTWRWKAEIGRAHV